MATLRFDAASTFSTAVAKATLSATQPAQPTATSISRHAATAISSDGQNTINIVFGTLAAMLALAAIIIGYLQLRQFKRGIPGEGHAHHGLPVLEVIEVLYVAHVVSRARLG